MVFEKIKVILSEQFDIEEEEITSEIRFREDLEADSLDLVELIMAIEDEFEIEVDDEDVDKISSVGDVVNYISGLI